MAMVEVTHTRPFDETYDVPITPICRIPVSLTPGVEYTWETVNLQPWAGSAAPSPCLYLIGPRREITSGGFLFEGHDVLAYDDDYGPELGVRVTYTLSTPVYGIPGYPTHQLVLRVYTPPGYGKCDILQSSEEGTMVIRRGLEFGGYRLDGDTPVGWEAGDTFSVEGPAHGTYASLYLEQWHDGELKLMTYVDWHQGVELTPEFESGEDDRIWVGGRQFVMQVRVVNDDVRVGKDEMSNGKDVRQEP